MFHLLLKHHDFSNDLRGKIFFGVLNNTYPKDFPLFDVQTRFCENKKNRIAYFPYSQFLNLPNSNSIKSISIVYMALSKNHLKDLKNKIIEKMNSHA